MRTVFAALTFALIAAFPLSQLSALSTQSDAPPSAHSPFEIIVMEADGCIYCGIFRRDILPAFESSPRGKKMPVRFVDINEIDTARVTLERPIDILPTFVIVHDQREIGRIPGYVGQHDFFQSINYVMSSSGHE